MALPINIESLINGNIVEPVMLNNKNLLIIWVPGGENRPYTCPKDFFSKKKESAYIMLKAIYIGQLQILIKKNYAKK